MPNWFPGFLVFMLIAVAIFIVWPAIHRRYFSPPRPTIISARRPIFTYFEASDRLEEWMKEDPSRIPDPIKVRRARVGEPMEEGDRFIFYLVPHGRVVVYRSGSVELRHDRGHLPAVEYR